MLRLSSGIIIAALAFAPTEAPAEKPSCQTICEKRTTAYKKCMGVSAPNAPDWDNPATKKCHEEWKTWLSKHHPQCYPGNDDCQYGPGVLVRDGKDVQPPQWDIKDWCFYRCRATKER